MSNERRASAIVIIALIAILIFQYWQTQPLYEKIDACEEEKETYRGLLDACEEEKETYRGLLDACEEEKQAYKEMLDAYEERIKDCEQNYPRKITEIRGPLHEEYLGKIVTVEGYLIISGVRNPILLQNLESIFMNMPIPEDRYIPIIGLDLKEMVELEGGLFRVKGIVTEHEENVAMSLKISDYLIELLDPPVWYVKELAEIYWIEWVGPIVALHRNFAVLISGGGNNAHFRYWNDLTKMYSILVNDYGYPPNHIIVIYKDGVPENNNMPVNFSATVANVTTAFTNVANALTEYDDLFIYTTNHGSGFWPTDNVYYAYLYGDIDTDGDEPESGYSESTYNRDFNQDGDKTDTIRVDEVLNLHLNERLPDDDLADLLDDIECRQMVIVMEQCFSGGFIHDLSGSNRVIMTACSEEEVSYMCDTEGNYDEFVYHFASGVDKPGLSADDDGDGDVSMSEAFNYAAQNDSQSETPLYDDNGDNSGHTEPLPNGGDGPNGDSVFLN